jgi:hypothetical protein
MPGEFIARNGVISRGNVVVTGSLTTSGSLTTTGTITATTLVVQTITSSISSVTGSTNFGSLLANTHTFTGSLNVTGALAVTTNGTEFQVNSTGVNLGNALTDSHVISGSLRVNPNGLFVSGSGLVGMGTTSPNTYTLAPQLVVDAGTNGGGITIKTATTSSTTNYGGLFFADGTTGTEQYRGFIQYNHNFNSLTDTLILGTAGTERLYINASGNVGIGTNTGLDGGLTVETNSNSFNALVLRDSRAFSTIPEVALAFRVKYNTAGAYATPSLLVAYKDNATDGNQAGSLAFLTNPNSSPVERMRITSAGNVGIGTNNPGANLHISGSGTFVTQNIENASAWYALYRAKSANASNYWQWGSWADGSYRLGRDGVADFMIMNANGQITTPYQPAFRAYHTTNGIWTLTPNDTFVFNATEYNVGSCYNTSNGRFTAPVAGVYQFNFYSIIYGPYNNGFIQFRKNGAVLTSGTNIHFTSTAASNVWSNVQFITSVYLNSGDYISLTNLDLTVNYHGDDWSSFSGYLVG